MVMGSFSRGYLSREPSLEEIATATGLRREDVESAGRWQRASLTLWFRGGVGRYSGLWARAQSRLYRNEILQENMCLKALVEIYTMHSFALL